MMPCLLLAASPVIFGCASTSSFYSSPSPLLYFLFFSGCLHRGKSSFRRLPNMLMMHRKNKILLFAILAGSSNSRSMLVAGQQSTRLLKKGGAGGGGSTTTVATVCPETAFERQLLVNVVGRPEDVTATELSILEQEFASSYNTLGSLTCPGVRTIQEVTIQLESGTDSTSTVAVNTSSTRSFSFRFQVHGICRGCIKPNLFMNYTIRSLKTMTVHQSGSGARRGSLCYSLRRWRANASDIWLDSEC
jgi:hypothetical protein